SCWGADVPLHMHITRREPSMTVSDYLVSLIRTLVPVLAGLVVAHAARVGLDLSGQVEPLLADIALGGYDPAGRAAERRWPAVGVLLGWKASPSYEERS